MNRLIRELLQGSRQAAARLISICEQDRTAAQAIMRALKPHLGRAQLIGVTGAPGTGKSTLINGLTGRLRKIKERVGVIAIDPTSPLSGGALLGDRIRMHDHARDPGVFIRSMATRAGTGGLSRTAAEAASILDALGMDRVFVETTGVGQSETAVRDLAHTVVVVVTPHLGDSLQMMKAGVLEIGDIIVVNKGDLPEAKQTAQDLEATLDLLPRERMRPPVVITSAEQGKGIIGLLRELEKARRAVKSQGKFVRAGNAIP